MESSRSQSSSGESTIRLSLDVSISLNERLEVLAQRLGCAKSDVLRRAIPFLRDVDEGCERGMKFGIGYDGQALPVEFRLMR